MGWSNRNRLYFLDYFHRALMGFPVNFVYQHTEVITKIAVVLVPAFFLGIMMLLASGKTKEVSELKGFPERNKND